MLRLPTATSAVPCTVSTVTTQVVTNLQRMPTARVDAPTLQANASQGRGGSHILGLGFARGAPLKDLAASVALEVLLQIPRMMVQLPSVLVGLLRLLVEFPRSVGGAQKGTYCCASAEGVALFQHCCLE